MSGKEVLFIALKIKIILDFLSFENDSFFPNRYVIAKEKSCDS